MTPPEAETITGIEQAAEVLLGAVLRAVRLLRQLQQGDSGGALKAEVNAAIWQLLGLAGGHCQFKAQLASLGLPAAQALCARARELMPEPPPDAPPAEQLRRARELVAGVVEAVGQAG